MNLLNRVPPVLRWISGLMVLLLILMMAYRFIFFYTYGSEGRPFSGSAFLLGLRFDLRIVSVIGLAMMLITFFRPLNPFQNPRAFVFWRALLTVVFVVFVLLYSADFYHYDYLQQRLNASLLNFLEDAAISFNMMWESYPLVKITVLFVFATALFYLFVKNHFIRVTKAKYVRLKSRVLWFAGFFLICAVFIFGQIGQYPLRWSDAFRFGDDFKANVALNPFQSFFSTLKFKNSSYNLKKVEESYPVMAEYFGISAKNGNAFNLKREVGFADTFSNKPNVVVIICESFSASKSTMFGNALNPTPYFDSLSNYGLFFERCFTPSFGTARGIWAVITGIPDVESPKTASRNPSAVDQHTIINDFRGYEKYYFLGGSTTWANIRGLLTNNISGLKIYEEEHFKSVKEDVWGISDKNLFLESSKILAAGKKPFFSVIQTANNHRPYTIPDSDLDEFTKLSFPEDTLREYGFNSNEEFNAFRYMDFSIMKLMEAAKRDGWFNNTIFAFVGDHGLRGDAGPMFPQAFTKQGIGAQHVPLLFYAPGIIAPGRVSEVSSQLDILPTVASIARQPYTNTTMGVNLLDSTKRNRYAFISDPDLHTIGVVGNEYYYRRNLKTNKTELVSTLNNERVPTSASNVKYMSVLTEAWYEMAKYLLLNNKKVIKEIQN